MVITVTLTEDPDAFAWDLERFSARADFRNIEVTGCEAEAVIEHCKGIVLCAIGSYYKNIPDQIKFVTVRNDLKRDEKH